MVSAITALELPQVQELHLLPVLPQEQQPQDKLHTQLQAYHSKPYHTSLPDHNKKPLLPMRGR